MIAKPTIVVSDKKGRIYDLPPLEACGMKGGNIYRLPAQELVKIPYGSELFMLPDRPPIGYDTKSKKFVSLDGYLAVAVFASPGWTLTYNSAYKETRTPDILPLFAYGAAAFYKGKLCVASVRVDRGLRHDLRYMDAGEIRENVRAYRKLFPKNRLIRHLETCALKYGCPNAKNFFLSKYEAPLPTSPCCNAFCIGCISHQPQGKCQAAQPRIKFVPTPEEAAEAALYHIKKVKDPVVSFGQGCEGEPLLTGDIIEKAVKIIRKITGKGTININTNGSRPRTIERLFDAGLDSIRVSLNSARDEYYSRYFKPRGYGFKDVLDSIRISKQKKGFVSINYLTVPGFTDSREEFDALRRLIRNYRIDMVQWRNLNYDPLAYFREMKIPAGSLRPVGIREVIRKLKEEFPKLVSGYFNPSKKSIKNRASQKCRP